MKQYILLYALFIATAICLGACNNDEDIDTANSIFPMEETTGNAFDHWLFRNYMNTYNVTFKYRMEDIESDQSKNLIPADYNKSVVLAKIVKHVWMEAYDELCGINFLRVYIPKTIHLIGSPAYDKSGTMVLGTAEGGMKITLYNVNSLNVENINIEQLNKFYFKTMHHEFAHILHQTKNYDPAFDRITENGQELSISVVHLLSVPRRWVVKQCLPVSFTWCRKLREVKLRCSVLSTVLQGSLSLLCWELLF